MSTFGQEVRRLRQLRRWSQEKLGEFAEVDQSTISAIERGVNTPEPPTVQRLAAAFGQSPAAFMVLAGHLPPPADTPPDTPPPPADKYESPIAEEDVVRYIEALPGHAFQERLARLRASLPPTSYRALCLRLYRAWMSNGELALDAYSLGRS